jgi:hypothetical protein
VEIISNRSGRRHDRRLAIRYNVSLRVEVWPESERKGLDPLFFTTRDISLRGFYFTSDRDFEVGSKFNFSIIFPRELTGDTAELMSGLARTVRLDQLRYGSAGRVGVGATIEETTRLYEESLVSTIH